MLRPMTPGDAEAVVALQFEAFSDLDRRLGLPVRPAPADLEPSLVRVTHLVGTDPGGAWVTEEDGAITGASLGIVREGVWGLSLLIVRPGLQSGGRGRTLLEAALAHGADARGGIILASEDARALRAYWRAGFRLLPSMDAVGVVKHRPAVDPRIRPIDLPGDDALVQAAGRAVRGAAHGPDVEVMARYGRMLVHPDGGFVALRGNDIRCIAAHDVALARDLLRAALAAVPPGEECRLDFIEANQDWAVDVVLEAGLELRPGGAVALRGDVGVFRPYVPSGAYL